jgi:hypothetical protein
MCVSRCAGTALGLGLAALDGGLVVFASCSVASLICMQQSLKFVTVTTINRLMLERLFDHYLDDAIKGRQSGPVNRQKVLLSPAEYHLRTAASNPLQMLKELMITNRQESVVIGAPVHEVIDSEARWEGMAELNKHIDNRNGYFICVRDGVQISRRQGLNESSKLLTASEPILNMTGRSDHKVYLWFARDCDKRMFLQGYLHAFVTSKLLGSIQKNSSGENMSRYSSGATEENLIVEAYNLLQKPIELMSSGKLSSIALAGNEVILRLI